MDSKLTSWIITAKAFLLPKTVVPLESSLASHPSSRVVDTLPPDQLFEGLEESSSLESQRPRNYIPANAKFLSKSL